MLTREGCLARQRRLLARMEEAGWDLFLTADCRTIYYLTGSLAPDDAPAAFVLESGGASRLLTPVEGEAAADRVEAVQTYSLARAIAQPFQDAARQLRDLLPASSARCGVERARTPGLFEELLEGAVIEDSTGTILDLRKRKHEDEIEEIRASLRYCAIAYRAAREAVAPGVSEIDVHLAMQAAVTRAAGTTIPFPGDFACGQRSIRGGGAPTGYLLQAGDLYVLDIFPAPHLYFGDTCRTFAVGTPTEEQRRAFEVVRNSIRVGEAAIRPGVAAREVYAAVRNYLDEQPEAERSLWHHVGHGIGLRGHEAPRIIPGSDDIFDVGDVFTLEPGIYRPALGGGIRLEDNYVLRDNGLENLFDFPMEL